MSVNDRVAMDLNAGFATDTLRQAYNLLLQEVNYFRLNGVASTTVAATPAVAIATTTSRVKTTNATVLRCAGALVALGASDNYWILTGGDLAPSSARRYLLCSNAAGVASVIASYDAPTVAQCRFPNLPANGVAIVGVLSISTNASTTFTPGTTALNAAGVTAAYVDGIDINVPLASLVVPS